MAYGTAEFKTGGLEPFELAEGTAANASSVVLDINDSSQRGVVLVDGEIQPASGGSGPTFGGFNLQNSSGTNMNLNYMGWQSNTSGFVDYSNGTSQIQKFAFTYINTNPQGLVFQVWIKFGTNNSFPYEDVMYHYRSCGFNNGLNTFSSWRGMGKVVSSGAVTKIKVYCPFTNMHTYRIRAYSFFG